jgi:hypothetical protein
LGQGTAGDLHRPLEHPARAAADQLAGFVGRDARPPGDAERVIDRRREVAVGIDQRSVEVEADDLEGEVGHSGSPWRRHMETATDWWHGPPP